MHLIPDPERFDGIRRDYSHQEVERQGGNIVGDRIQRGILLLLEDFYVALAAVAGLRSNKSVALLNLAVCNALGRAAEGAFDADVVPNCAAQ